MGLRRRLMPLSSPVLLTTCVVSHSSSTLAANEEASAPEPENDTFWHARVGIGLNPVIGQDDRLPTAYTGFGASLSGFVSLPLRLSAGAGLDWEQYTFDSNNHGDSQRTPPLYTGEILTQMRLMGLVQWDILRRGLVTPFVVLGAGYGWEKAALTGWQCTPVNSRGLVMGGGFGVQLALSDKLGAGVEYRGNTLPLGPTVCTLALFDDEPLGAPSDFFSHRIGITLSVRN